MRTCLHCDKTLVGPFPSPTPGGQPYYMHDAGSGMSVAGCGNETVATPKPPPSPMSARVWWWDQDAEEGEEEGETDPEDLATGWYLCNPAARDGIDFVQGPFTWGELVEHMRATEVFPGEYVTFVRHRTDGDWDQAITAEHQPWLNIGGLR